MWLADQWRDFSLLDAGHGMKLEQWLSLIHILRAPHSLATAKATNTHMTIPAIMSSKTICRVPFKAIPITTPLKWGRNARSPSGTGFCIHRNKTIRKG